jgi:hypothetical protein
LGRDWLAGREAGSRAAAVTLDYPCCRWLLTPLVGGRSKTNKARRPKR